MPLPSQPDVQARRRGAADDRRRCRRRSSPVAAVARGLGLVLLIVGSCDGQEARGEPRVDARTAAGTQPRDSAPHRPSMSQPRRLAAGTPSPVGAERHRRSCRTNLGPGAMIGRWEIIKRLGSGGMADVYLARARGEAGFEKHVAVKVMHPHLARNERAVEHFLDEARLAARIAHPNVVAIQDLGKIGNDYVIVMEYVDGVDLERLLASARAAQRQVPIDVGLGILCRICDGLNAAHKRDRARRHAAATSSTATSRARTCSCRGRAASRSSTSASRRPRTQSHLTVAGETKGTPSMMAPEQRVGEQVDVRADVYSVGAVGYEILTGHGVNLDLAALAHLGIENWPHLPPPSIAAPAAAARARSRSCSARCRSIARSARPTAPCSRRRSRPSMKQHGLPRRDKDIARWVSAELAADSRRRVGLQHGQGQATPNVELRRRSAGLRSEAPDAPRPTSCGATIGRSATCSCGAWPRTNRYAGSPAHAAATPNAAHDRYS